MILKRKPKRRLSLRSFIGGTDPVTADLASSEAKAKRIYNFDSSSGALVKAKGFCDYFVRDGGVSFLCELIRLDNATVYAARAQNGGFVGLSSMDGTTQGSTEIEVDDVVLDADPVVLTASVRGVPSLLMSTPAIGLFVWDGYTHVEFVYSAPHMTSMAMHNERLFACVDGEEDTLWYSDDLDPLNWQVSLDEAGFIRFDDERGALKKVVSFGGYLYVFRERGITRVSAYGDQTEFAVTHLFTAGGKIYDKTVAVCGNVIMFLTQDGLFVFDGAEARRISPKSLPAIKATEESRAFFRDGKYYLSCYTETEDEIVGCESGEFVNNAVLEYDVYDGKSVLYRGVDVRGFYYLPAKNAIFMTQANGQPLVFCDEGTLCGEPVEAKWVMPYSHLGVPHREKRLEEITFFADCETTLTIKSNRESVSYDILPRSRLARVKLRLVGDVFAIELSTSDPEGSISAPTIVYS